MPEFNLIPEARSAPTECFLCGEFVGPFVATSVEKIEGTVILCAPLYDVDGSVKRSGCVGQIAAAAGYIAPLDHAAEVNASASLEKELRDTIADLEEHLERAGELVLASAATKLDELGTAMDARFTAIEDAITKIVKPPAKTPQKRTP